MAFKSKWNGDSFTVLEGEETKKSKMEERKT